MTPFSGAVLTGGRSRRMGADKAFLVVDGQPMVLRVAGALRAAGAADVHAIGGDRDGLGALGLSAHPDARQGEGPLAGLLTALDVVEQDIAVVLATDLAWIDAATVTSLVAALSAHTGAAAAVARADRLEPLCAAWHVSRSGDALHASYDAGERAVHRALGGLRVVTVEVAAAAVVNANTPADLHR
jgi:molybdopterin-guanine dinucleotide biosynthesis protein A